jgi:hypothetical protein
MSERDRELGGKYFVTRHMTGMGLRYFAMMIESILCEVWTQAEKKPS